MCPFKYIVQTIKCKFEFILRELSLFLQKRLNIFKTTINTIFHEVLRVRCL